MKLRTLTVNAVLAAAYIVVTFLIQPISFGQVQFRIAEMFNHLVVFNKKYIYGIVLGVFLSNLFFSPILPYDLFFGTGQSLIALLTTIVCSRFIKGTWARMAVNTAVFTLTMAIIAWEWSLFNYPFFLTWLFTAIGELGVMAVGAPIIYAINKRLDFKKLI